MTDNLLITAMYPHPPIIIPEITGDKIKEVETTVNAVKKLSDKIVALSPDTIILITPHSNFNPYRFSIYSDANLRGDFRNFRAPEVVINFQNDLEFIETLKKNIDNDDNGLLPIPAGSMLDHGTSVPMYFISKAGYKGKLVAINYCALDQKTHIEFGKIIRRSIDESDKKFAFIASGDLSHRLLPTAPAGFDPDACKFDEFIVEAISSGNYNSLVNIDQNLREIAGECGYNSLMTALGVINCTPVDNHVFSYEGNLGVGYLIASL